MKPNKGFSLVELLVALLILAEIATFTIPKILVSQQNNQANLGAKQIASIISGLFINEYYANGGERWVISVKDTFGAGSLEGFIPQKLNYVKRLTGGEAMTYAPGGSATT